MILPANYRPPHSNGTIVTFRQDVMALVACILEGDFMRPLSFEVHPVGSWFDDSMVDLAEPFRLFVHLHGLFHFQPRYHEPTLSLELIRKPSSWSAKEFDELTILIRGRRVLNYLAIRDKFYFAILDKFSQQVASQCAVKFVNSQVELRSDSVAIRTRRAITKEVETTIELVPAIMVNPAQLPVGIGHLSDAFKLCQLQQGDQEPMWYLTGAGLTTWTINEEPLLTMLFKHLPRDIRDVYFVLNRLLQPRIVPLSVLPVLAMPDIPRLLFLLECSTEASLLQWKRRRIAARLHSILQRLEASLLTGSLSRLSYDENAIPLLWLNTIWSNDSQLAPSIRTWTSHLSLQVDTGTIKK